MENISAKIEHTSTKQEILNTAIQLFQKFGYDKVTIAQICKTCDIAKTTFYYYFKSKESLIADFYNQTDTLLMEHTAQILAAENNVEQLWQICSFYMQLYIDTGTVITKEIFQINIKNDYLRMAPDDAKLKDIMILLIERGQATGQIKNPTPAKALYKQMIYLLDGVSFIWVTKDCSFDLLTEARESFDGLLMI